MACGVMTHIQGVTERNIRMFLILWRSGAVRYTGYTNMCRSHDVGGGATRALRMIRRDGGGGYSLWLQLEAMGGRGTGTPRNDGLRSQHSHLWTLEEVAQPIPLLLLPLLEGVREAGRAGVQRL